MYLVSYQPFIQHNQQAQPAKIQPTFALGGNQKRVQALRQSPQNGWSLKVAQQPATNARQFPTWHARMMLNFEM